MLAAMIFLILIILIVSIVYKFVYKLISVRKKLHETSSSNKYGFDDNKSQDHTKNLKRLITKNTILTICAISVTFSFIGIIIWTVIDEGKVASEAIGDIMATMDAFTNFICIFLSLQYNEELYSCICGCIDRSDRDKGTVDIEMQSIQEQRKLTATVETHTVTANVMSQVISK